jgi:hypothetical protein
VYQPFDYFGLPERPPLVLCQPDRTPIFTLGNINNIQLKLRYNSVGELSFDADEMIKNTDTGADIDMPYYDYLEYKRLIYIPNIGYYMITKVEEKKDGKKGSKTVTADSGEIEFNYKHISGFTGKFKFYDYFNPGPTLLGTILSFVPGWNVGSIDASLLSLYRTFNVSDSTILSFLMKECEDAYACVFQFDTINKLISATTIQNSATQTSIVLSFDNLLKSTDITSVSDELVTALNVLGAGDLSINQVNPLGTNKIYNFSYYMSGSTSGSSNFMSGSLITAIQNWQSAVSGCQVLYANTLTALEQANYNLLVLESGSAISGSIVSGSTLIMSGSDVSFGLLALNEQQKQNYSTISQNIQGMLVAKGPYAAAASAIALTNSQIITTTQAIARLTSQINSLEAQLVTINNFCSFQNNFTPQQLIDLSQYIVENTYTNTGFVQTDSMTLVDIQNEAQQLYDLAETVLANLCVPKYTFTIDSTNFVMLKEFQNYTQQLQLGSILYLLLENGVVSYPIVLEIDLQYDDPSKFALIFGNRLRLDNSTMIYADIFGDSVTAATTTKLNTEQWGNFQSNYKDDVANFITSALDASKNAVINASNQNVTIDQTGIRGRHQNPDGSYSPEQFWMIDNVLVFTADNWNTAAMAIGSIQSPTSGSTWGIVAQSLVGNLVAAENLYISNEAGTFSVSGSGATLVDASFTITTGNGKNTIILDPNNGIMIEQLSPSGSQTPLMYLDPNDGSLYIAGNGTFGGILTAPSGNIGGWIIRPDGLYAPDGVNYIKSSMEILLGPLYIHGNDATFAGNIYAANLLDQIQTNNIANFAVTDAQIANMNAGKINAGVMSADYIFGGIIRAGNTYADPDFTMYYDPLSKYEFLTAKSGIYLQSSSLAIAAGDATIPQIGIEDYGITMLGGSLGHIDIGYFTDTISFNGTISVTDSQMNTGVGITGTFIL